MSRRKTIENPELSRRDKILYGSAGFADAATYALVSTFLLFYLTTIAGIQPALAGSLVAFGSIWDAVTCPVFGYLSDNCHSRMGRRRPFLLMGSVPLAACTMFLFTAIGAGLAVKVVYYVVVSMIYWSAFSCFFIPYMAFGAELTHNYDERTILRSYTSIANNIGGIVGGVCPTIAIDYLCSSGISRNTSWQVTALVIGILTFCAIMLCFFGFKDRDIPKPKEQHAEKFSVKKMFRDYIDVLRIKPLLLLISASIISLIGITMFNSDRLYFLTYNMGFNGAQISLVLFICSCFGFIIPFVLNAMTRWFDKRRSFLIVIGGSSLIVAAFRFIGVTGWPTLIIMMAFFALCNTGYWQLMPTLLYDVGEYDEYYNGKNRIGSIMSLQSLAEAAAEALAIQLLGIILQLVGFNGALEVQSDFTLSWIATCLMIVPVMFTIIACIFIYKYPITREVFQEIQQKLEDRKS